MTPPTGTVSDAQATLSEWQELAGSAAGSSSAFAAINLEVLEGIVAGDSFATVALTVIRPTVTLPIIPQRIKPTPKPGAFKNLKDANDYARRLANNIADERISRLEDFRKVANSSIPSGTGFRHITSGAEDAAAKLVGDGDVSASAGIVESKLTLNYSTHSNANDPASDQKNALAGTSGTPSATNKYVTDSDSRNSDARTPTAHGHAELDVTNLTTDLGNKEATANKGAASGYCGLDSSQKVAIGNIPTGSSSSSVCIGNDSRLSDSRTPTAHATTHKSGQSDAIKLDEFTAPTDNTNLNVSKDQHGLCPKLPDDDTKFLNGKGGYTTPSGGAGTTKKIAAGTSVTNSNATERNKTSSSYIKIKEIKVNAAQVGRVTVAFQLMSGYAGREVRGRMYVNGGAVGAEHSESAGTDYVSFSDPTTADFAANDLVQIYVRYTGSSAAAYVDSMELRYKWQITAIGTDILSAPLDTTTTTQISTTNQDPA